MQRHILFLSILMILTTIPGLANAITYERINAPEFDVTYLDRIAVLPFETNDATMYDGAAVSDRLATHLAQEGYLKMVERLQVEKVMGEGNFSRSDFADTNLAAQFGKLVGADAVVIGRITTTYVETEGFIYAKDNEKSWSLESVFGDSKSDSDQQKDTETKKETEKIRTLERTGDVNIDTKVVEVQTGRIIASKVAYQNWKQRGVDEQEISALPPKGEILEDCVAKCMNVLIRAYTPHKVTIERELRPKSHANADEMKAKYLAESGFFQEAIDLSVQIIQKEPKKTDVRGNLAILYEAIGDFEKADYWLREALDANQKQKTAHDLLSYRNSMLEAWFFAQKENLSKRPVMVLEISGDKVYIDAGKERLAKLGDRFIVCRETIIKHPVTGETMGSDKRQIAVIEIVELQDKMSVAKIIEILDDELTIEKMDTAVLKNDSGE